MSSDSQDGFQPTRPVRPPPWPLNVDTLGPALRSSPPPPQPTNWKKILLIAGLSLLGALAFLAVVGALVFGGCMYLIKKAGH